ncbi:MAG: hypothetical protein GY941_03340 [Planctomycetes bacterium]|nr:hypothetical protein [Planctomycetota bacterium]
MAKISINSILLNPGFVFVMMLLATVTIIVTHEQSGKIDNNKIVHNKTPGSQGVGSHPDNGDWDHNPPVSETGQDNAHAIETIKDDGLST